MTPSEVPAEKPSVILQGNDVASQIVQHCSLSRLDTAGLWHSPHDAPGSSAEHARLAVAPFRDRSMLLNPTVRQMFRTCARREGRMARAFSKPSENA